MNKLIVLKTTLRRKMSCRKCISAFSLFNWKLKCAECEDNYCSKCVMKQDGLLVCEVCAILIKRPVIRNRLMELKSKDLQDYLNRHNISTHGVVEKQELVEILCRSTVPVRQKKSNRKFPPIFGGSVPNLAARSQTYLNNLRTNAEAAFNNNSRPTPFRPNVSPSERGNIGHQSASNSPARSPPPQAPPVSPTSTPTSPTNTNNRTTPSMTQEQNNTNHTPAAPPENEEEPTTNQPQASNGDNIDVQPDPVSRRFAAITNYELEDFNCLSGRELKQLLSYNRVDFKGCVEKKELVERAERLWSDSQKLRENVETTNYHGDCCKICMDAPLDCVLLECGHIATCIKCGKQLAECPICRQYVSRVVRTFKA